VVDFFQGTLAAEAFLEKAKSQGEQTEAHAYLAFKLDAEGQGDEAMRHFSWVLDKGDKNYSEYNLVKNELERRKWIATNPPASATPQ
jgi:hypothetical protein